MIVPYKKPRPHRVLGWLVDSETVLHEDGRLMLVEGALAEGVQVWAPSELLRQLTREGFGSAVLWRYVAIGWNPWRDASDWPVRGLALEAPADPAEAIDGLARWRDWLESYGAAPAGSLGGSGLSLVKATLERELFTTFGEVPPIRFTIGGRQEHARPAPMQYSGPMVHSDIQAAYANTLGTVLYGGRWARHEWRPLWQARFEKNPGTLMYVRAIVDVPDLEDVFPQLPPGHRGPLLDRPRSQPSEVTTLFWAIVDRFPAGRRIQGTWTWPELEAAEAAGCRVRRVLDVWINETAEQPFLPWLDAIHVGRGLPGWAGRLAKATGNATWGQFAIAKGRRQVVAKGRDERLPLRGGNPSQRAFDLAESIAGSVRANLYRGMLYAGPHLIAAHTDGLWSHGPGVLGWRVTGYADELRLFDAQHLAYRTTAVARELEAAAAGDSADATPWQYTVAGQLEPEVWFEEAWQRAQGAAA